jgi:dolichol-phosphate mannosyltransferase
MHSIIKFGAVGASGYVVNLGIFALAVGAGAGHLTAATAAFLVAVTSNFWLNRRWTFSGRDAAPTAQAARFLTVSVMAFLVAAGLLELLAGAAGLPPLAAQGASIVAVAPLSFLANRDWAFALNPAPGRI